MRTLKTLIASATLAASATVANAGTTGLSAEQIQALDARTAGTAAGTAGLPAKKIKTLGAGATNLGLLGSTGPLPGASAPPPGTYTFTLESFSITNTRALFDDTDYASISVSVGGGAPITSPAKFMGNLDNGSYKVGLSIPNVVVGAGQAVDFSYTIVNSGFNKDTLEQDLISWIGQAAQQAAGKGAAALTGLLTTNPAATAIANVVGQKAGSWASNKLLNIIFADCDGTVAAGDHAFSGAQLAAFTSQGTTGAEVDNNKGSNSPVGCGSNSQYYVTWSVRPSNATGVVGRGPGGGGGGGGGVGAPHHQLQ